MIYLILYLLLGCMLSVLMCITSRSRLPLLREIVTHVVIALFWPLVLFNVIRIYIALGPLDEGDERD